VDPQLHRHPKGEVNRMKFLIWLYTILRIPVPPQLLAPRAVPPPLRPAVSAPAPQPAREPIDPTWERFPLDPAIGYPVYAAHDGKMRLGYDGFAFTSLEALNLYKMIRDHKV
jgi:hypothetical protein